MTTSNSFTFILDESGSKGYSNNTEKYKGEFGLAAGVIIPTEYVDLAKDEIDELLSDFIINGKLHITDLKSMDQQALRNRILDYLLDHQANWVYEAIYVEGFHSFSKFTESFRKRARENSQSKVKISGNIDKKLLHSELLSGAIIKAISNAYSRVGDKVHLKVIVDKIDASTVKYIKVSVDKFLSIGQKNTLNVSGFDPETKKVVKGSINTQIVSGIEDFRDSSGITYEIEISTDPITVLADVVANSVRYFLEAKDLTKHGKALNTISAIDGYLLKDFVYGVTNDVEGSAGQLADTIYRHPDNMQ